MKILCTLDDRFDALAGYPFEPRYVEVDAGDDSPLRIHYLDEGPSDGEVVLLLHGEPSWSYLYRRMIPVLAAAGLRAVAIDLVGFGRSDKPADRGDYTYQAHVDWTWAAIETIDLDGITLVGQDWGGLIGLRLVGEHPDPFARVVAANTFPAHRGPPPRRRLLGLAALQPRHPRLPRRRDLKGGCVTDLDPEVIAAYDAPFPDDSYTAGRPPVPHARAHEPRRPGRAGQPGRLGVPAPLLAAVPVRLLRL